MTNSETFVLNIEDKDFGLTPDTKKRILNLLLSDMHQNMIKIFELKNGEIWLGGYYETSLDFLASRTMNINSGDITQIYNIERNNILPSILYVCIGVGSSILGYRPQQFNIERYNLVISMLIFICSGSTIDQVHSIGPRNISI